MGKLLLLSNWSLIIGLNGNKIIEFEIGTRILVKLEIFSYFLWRPCAMQLLVSLVLSAMGIGILHFVKLHLKD